MCVLFQAAKDGNAMPFAAMDAAARQGQRAALCAHPAAGGAGDVTALPTIASETRLAPVTISTHTHIS